MSVATVSEADRPAETGTEPLPDPLYGALSELGTPAELAQLLLDPVFYGFGVPRGHGTPVMVLPGFMGSDLYLMPMLGWLLRIGYRPYESTLERNVGCPNQLARRLLARTERIADQTGHQVAIIGHSKGGLLARGIACARPDLVSQVIALGSPFAPNGTARPNPFVQAMIALARERMRSSLDVEYRDTCYTSECQCEFVQRARNPFPDSVPFTSIYTRSDGVVDWHTCLDRDAGNNIEVFGSHTGLAFNSDVYRHVARRLAIHRVAVLARGA